MFEEVRRLVLGFVEFLATAVEIGWVGWMACAV